MFPSLTNGLLSPTHDKVGITNLDHSSRMLQLQRRRWLLFKKRKESAMHQQLVLAKQETLSVNMFEVQACECKLYKLFKTNNGQEGTS
jgi:hypothetical protein